MVENNELIEFDVVVVGSGAGAMVAALHARDLGLSTLVVEKAGQFGGTSATSGGAVWIPMSPGAEGDTPEKARTYLRNIVGPEADMSIIDTYIAHAAPVAAHIRRFGVNCFSVPSYPDYYSEVEGAVSGRSMLTENRDGAELGDEFFHMRDSNPLCLAFNRYAMDFEASGTLTSKLPGWQWAGFKLLANYWLDLRWRLKTRRDRKLVMGRAMCGALRQAMVERDIPLWLNTPMIDLEMAGGEISHVVCRRNGRDIRIRARHGVILGAGGYEQNQDMRDQHMPLKLGRETSLTPPGGNEGDAIRIGAKIGAAVGGMDQVWWAPTVRLPMNESPNLVVPFGLIFERGKPGAMIVNQHGNRYANEALSYDRFGLAMIEEEKRTGAANPSWMIFDHSFRSTAPVGAGAIAPSWAMPDWRLPKEWWDSYLFKADTLAGLVAKIGLPEENVIAAAKQINRAARSGVDELFGRGSTAYDQFTGGAGHKPNSCLGTIDQGPFYAIPVRLGDLGTKGGLRFNSDAQVMDESGLPIPGLYAIGNTTCAPYGRTYPGAGCTLGLAITFGFLASEHIAKRSDNQRAQMS